MATDTPTETAPPAASGWRRYRRAGILIVVVAVLVVAGAFVVGVTGLFANPVRSVNSDGTTTLQGEFEPYQCDTGHCAGYIQAGARSVFVLFPDGCPAPVRASQITLRGKPAPDLGSGAYRAESCARPV